MAAPTITCSGLPTGFYLQAYDGTYYSKWKEEGGTTTLDVTHLTRPFDFVRAYHKNPDTSGVCIAEVTNETITDLGYGDTFYFERWNWDG